MSIVFRADHEPARSRMDYWRHLVEQAIGPLEVRDPPGGLDARDRLRFGDVGATRVVELSIGKASVADRAARHIRASDPDLYKIDVVARGNAVVAQDGRQAVHVPGDFTLVDLSRPCRWAMTPAQIVAVVFPPALLPLPRDELARLTGVRIRGDRGAGALISAVARQLPGRLDDVADAGGARVGTAVLDLLAVALAERLDRARLVSPESRQRALVLQIRAHIEEQLGDPDLSPGSIAAAHFISLRYLHKLFETEETTVADWIRRRRLERCRSDLLDPAFAGRPVAAIGARWGFASAAHFSRAFRAAYGVPPAEYRALIDGPRCNGRDRRPALQRA